MPDHFSSVAAKYAEHRPSYPAELGRYLAQLAPARSLAWDCGTGSGQAAILLADLFDRVVATDPSAAQLSHAVLHPHIEYRRAPEAGSGLPDESCDLVTAAQAAHWFDAPAFYREARRVLKPNGVLAVWVYARICVSPAIDPILQWFEHDYMGPYWPPGRELARNEYRDLPFPFPRIDTPTFVMRQEWTLADMLGMLSSTSAAARYREIEHADPLPAAAGKLEPLWGSARREVRWPLRVLVGRKGNEAVKQRAMRQRSNE